MADAREEAALRAEVARLQNIEFQATYYANSYRNAETIPQMRSFVDQIATEFEIIAEMARAALAPPPAPADEVSG